MDKPIATQQKAAAYHSGLLAAYVTLYSALNLSNKWILSASTGYGFMFPLALGCAQMAFISLALLPHMLSERQRDTHREAVQKQWRGLLAIGLLMACDVAFNNTSLVNMSLSLNQIIRQDCMLGASGHLHAPMPGSDTVLFQPCT